MSQTAAVGGSQLSYARIAGFAYLLLIVLYMSGEFLISGIAGGADFAANARSVVASERLYRFALVLQAFSSACTVVLAYALYVTVRPVNTRLAQMAMCWRLGESFIGASAVIFSFVALSIYASAADMSDVEMKQSQALMTLVRDAHFTAFNSSTLFFSFGSAVFFYLFLKSDYLPKIQSVFGLFASILVTLTSLSNLVFPEHAGTIQFGWLPMFVSEIVTGLWLLFRGIKVR